MNNFCIFWLLFVVFEVWFQCVFTMHSSKALEGYPAGYLPNCPGVNTSIYISPAKLKALTISVQQKGTIFSLRTTYNYYQMKSLAADPGIDLRKPTVLYAGGYMDTPSFPPGVILGATYKKLGYNVLLLNTQAFTVTEYALASRNIRTIGKHAAEMLVTLTKYGLDPRKLSLVGLSLGAHTASFIAKNYRLMTGMNISRITGLDPSGPCFRNLGPEDRLDDTDADFVDVIDTNIDGWGMAAPVGHVNFYVNGGEFQPGDFIWIPCNVLCSHLRSLTLWIAALYNPDKFIAMQCSSVQEARDKNCYEHNPLVTNVVGLNTDRGKKGIFYLATHNNYPYFMGEKGLIRENEFFDNKVNLIKRNLVRRF